MALVYKIGKKGTETFVKGTPAYNTYDKDGRIFQTLGKLRSFLTSSLKHKTNTVSEWFIIEYELTVKKTQSVSDTVTSKTIAKMLMK